MVPKLQRLFDILENDRRQLLTKISSLSNEEFNYAPEGKWSIQKILSHLITAEQLSILYIRKKMLGIDAAENSGARESAKMILLRISQRLPFKFKAPRLVEEHTPVYASVEELLTAWEKERRMLGMLLDKFNDQQLNKNIYKHARVGMLNIRHAVMFFHEHYLHHLPQINKLITNRGN